MKTEIDAVLRVPLSPTAEQERRLLALQTAFAEVCNAIAPRVAETGVWNRVALHHMAYRPLREQYPQLGSQMICNAIYAVSRTCRWVFQSPGSPFFGGQARAGGMPTLRFSPRCPVYLDRHTFSLKRGQASLFTLDGRMRFQLDIGDRREALFHSSKLVEILLLRVHGRFELRFHLQAGRPELEGVGPAAEAEDDLVDYLEVDGATLPVPALAGRSTVTPSAPARRMS